MIRTGADDAAGVHHDAAVTLAEKYKQEENIDLMSGIDPFDSAWPEQYLAGLDPNWGMYDTYPDNGEATPVIDGSGTGSHQGQFWQDFGNWNSGNGTTYPKLYWEP